MQNDLFGFFFAFLGGCIICFINFLISRGVLLHRAKLFSTISIIHQVLNVGYLAALYFIADNTPWSLIYLLIGGALGATLPMLYFTGKLLKLSDSAKKREQNTIIED